MECLSESEKLNKKYIIINILFGDKRKKNFNEFVSLLIQYSFSERHEENLKINVNFLTAIIERRKKQFISIKGLIFYT